MGPGHIDTGLRFCYIAYQPCIRAKKNFGGSYMPQVPLSVLLLAVGFFLLIFGADRFVDGCSSIAKTLRVPSAVIGLTIVALGTSLPEAAVSTTAALSGSSNMSAGNCVCSNLFNLLVICGLCALFQPLPVNAEFKKRDFPISMIVTALVLFFGMDFLLGRSENKISRIEGIIMFLSYLGYLAFLVVYSLKHRTEAADEEDYKILPVWKSILYIVLGAAGIVFGGNLSVDNAAVIASACGMSDTLIGLTILAVGTSLPELVTSIVAAKKNELDLALGNCIGSNIENFLFVLGLSATVSPLTISYQVMNDIVILGCVCIIVLIMILTRKDLRKKEGAIMLCMYAAYMVYIFYRNFA